MNRATEDGLLDYLKRATEDGVAHGYPDQDCPVCRVIKRLEIKLENGELWLTEDEVDRKKWAPLGDVAAWLFTHTSFEVFEAFEDRFGRFGDEDES